MHREERLELARELHDIVAHHITGIVLHAQAARIVRRKNPEQLDTPEPEQLSELITRFTGPPVRLRLPDDESVSPPEVTSTVYRIVQESLTNIARHATHARSVTVDVSQDRHDITVEVIDDAPAAPTRYPRHSGHGLVSMRERVEALSGTLRAGPRAGPGWAVRATLPLSAQERR